MTKNGPISVKSPYREDAPGPPCSQMIQGVSSTDWPDTGKYQNQRLALYSLFTCKKSRIINSVLCRAGIGFFSVLALGHRGARDENRTSEQIKVNLLIMRSA